MAEIDDRLSQMLADPDSMKKVMDIASSIMAQRKESAATEPDEAAPPAPIEAQPIEVQSVEPPAAGGLDLSSILQMVGPMLGGMGGSGSSPSSDTDAASSAPPSGLGSILSGIDISELPKIMQAISGKNAYIKPEKVNLLNALKPYFGEERTPSIDRAVKMANLAKVAKNALGGGLFKK